MAPPTKFKAGRGKGAGPIGKRGGSKAVDVDGPSQRTRQRCQVPKNNEGDLLECVVVPHTDFYAMTDRKFSRIEQKLLELFKQQEENRKKEEDQRRAQQKVEDEEKMETLKLQYTQMMKSIKIIGDNQYQLDKKMQTVEKRMVENRRNLPSDLELTMSKLSMKRMMDGYKKSSTEEARSRMVQPQAPEKCQNEEVQINDKHVEAVEKMKHEFDGRMQRQCNLIMKNFGTVNDNQIAFSMKLDLMDKKMDKNNQDLPKTLDLALSKLSLTELSDGCKKNSTNEARMVKPQTASNDKNVGNAINRTKAISQQQPAPDAPPSGQELDSRRCQKNTRKEMGSQTDDDTVPLSDFAKLYKINVDQLLAFGNRIERDIFVDAAGGQPIEQPVDRRHEAGPAPPPPRQNIIENDMEMELGDEADVDEREPELANQHVEVGALRAPIAPVNEMHATNAFDKQQKGDDEGFEIVKEVIKNWNNTGRGRREDE